MADLRTRWLGLDLPHPLVVGSGARLFGNGLGQIPLELTESRTLATGVLDLTYRPVTS